MRAEERLRIYTDGACQGNPGPGGWAVCYRDPSGRLVERSGSERRTTNNRMEMRAAIEALKELGDRPGTIVTDSEYLRRGITSWIRAWKRNGWRTSTGGPVRNQDLWQELDELNGPQVQWEWVKGHAGDPLNERCNSIAQSLARSQPNPPRANPRPTTATFAPQEPRYLSYVNRELQRHASWPECQARVSGVSGARFRKCRNEEEEWAVLRAWRVPRERR